MATLKEFKETIIDAAVTQLKEAYGETANVYETYYLYLDKGMTMGYLDKVLIPRKVGYVFPFVLSYKMEEDGNQSNRNIAGLGSYDSSYEPCNATFGTANDITFLEVTRYYDGNIGLSFIDLHKESYHIRSYLSIASILSALKIKFPYIQAPENQTESDTNGIEL